MSVSEVIKKVIDLADKVRQYYETELPKRFPTYPLLGPDDDEDDLPPPPEEKELRDFLATLSDDMIYRLASVQYLGRCELGPDDLTPPYKRLKSQVFDAQEAARMMLVFKGSLAGELSDGLDELHKHKINVDKMPLKQVKARK